MSSFQDPNLLLPILNCFLKGGEKKGWEEKICLKTQTYRGMEQIIPTFFSVKQHTQCWLLCLGLTSGENHL